MSEIIDDYKALLQIDANSRRQWVQRNYPNGAYLQWWLALSEYARYDREIEWGVEILELGVELKELPPLYAVAELARLAILVARPGIHAPILPVAATPDGVGRRFIDAIPLTVEESIAAAERRRNEILTDPKATLLPGDTINPSPLPDDPGIDKLQDLESTLRTVLPLVDSIRDQALANKVKGWLTLMSDQWDIGERAGAVADRQLKDYLNAHREPSINPEAER
jgi:hypothetical protein